jgi:hypothetical protein
MDRLTPIEQIEVFLVWACLALNMVAFVWLLLKVHRYWCFYDKWVRNYKIVLITYTFAITFLTGEVIAKNLVLSGYRYAVLDAAAIFLLYTVATNHHHPAGRPFTEFDRRHHDDGPS